MTTTNNKPETHNDITEITVAASRLPLLADRIAKLNARGARFGAENALTMEIVEEFERGVRWDGRAEAAEIPVPMARVQITGRVWTIDGWTFAGRIECTPGGNIVHRSPNADDAIDFEALRERAPHCDHCETNRRRIDCFVLRNADGETKLVGRNCLADYLRDADAVRGALKTSQLYLEIGEWILNFNAPCPGFWGARFRLPVVDFLAFVSAAIRYSGSYEKGTTAEIANDIARGDIDDADAWPNEGDFARATAAAEWARNMDPRNGYTRNLKAALSNLRVDRRNENLVASALVAFDRHLDAQARAAAPAADDGGHLGTVGETLTRMLKVTGIRTGDGRFGIWTLLSFVDRDGNVVKWFASGDVSREFERGACYKLAGIVKKHDEYRGEKQTQLTRCRVLTGPLYAAA